MPLCPAEQNDSSEGNNEPDRQDLALWLLQDAEEGDDLPTNTELLAHCDSAGSIDNNYSLSNYSVPASLLETG